MTLKTLKEIDASEILYKSNGSSSGALNINRNLRKEAISWIKAIRKVQKKGDTLFKEHGKIGGLDIDIFDYEQNDSIGMIKWIKHFFNITEEERK